jgi:hypothetical protein
VAEGEKVNPIQAQKFLKGMDYPASKKDLVEKARSEGADAKVVSSLERMPGEKFQTPAEVSKALGKVS